MPAFKDLTGQRFGRLVVQQFTDRRDSRSVIWSCRCDCGNVTEGSSRNLCAGALASCGCLNTETSAQRRLHLVGEMFGRLTVLECIGINKWGNLMWRCSCSCKCKTVVVAGGHLQTQTKPTLSCGCISRESTSQRFAGRTDGIIHGHTTHEHVSRTYTSWQGMIQRCTNPNVPAWKYYGGAGVTVCLQWRTFEGFLASMGERPEGTTLSRFADTGKYEPGNVAWHTRSEQQAEANKKKLLNPMMEEHVIAA